MPIERESVDDVRPFEFHEPEELLDPEKLYTVAEIARILQGVEPEVPLDPETEGILLDWAIPWMLNHSESFVFAEPQDDTEPGYYGLKNE